MSTTVGPKFPLESFINIRIGLNQEASAANLPRYTGNKETSEPSKAGAANGAQIRNGRVPPSPATPATPGTVSPGQGPTSTIGIRGQHGTVRFMLDAARAGREKAEVSKYFVVEEEEYTEEVPIESERAPHSTR